MEDCHRCAIDVVVVWKFDRFARLLKTLIAGFELCRSLGIGFVSVTEAVDTSVPAEEMMLQMISVINCAKSAKQELVKYLRETFGSMWRDQPVRCAQAEHTLRDRRRRACQFRFLLTRGRNSSTPCTDSPLRCE
jgi:hypothetical protein